MLHGKRVLVGITGGIAAYKSATLVRAFIKEGAEVRVVMTPSAKDFITPLTLSTLSGNSVWLEFKSDEKEGSVWNSHVELGLWADFMVIAPATAHSLSAMATGAADNLLLATYLSAKCPVYIAPAMDLDMYKHPSTKASLDRLESFGNIVIPAAFGSLASGLTGEGRMAEPEDIVTFIKEHLQKNAPLYGKRVLITAGPTYEAIDPVRFIGNHASGKMGFALAQEASRLGASVTLISGPTALEPEDASITWIQVVSAADMYHAVHQYFENTDIAIMAAAVADYTPQHPEDRKIKKDKGVLQLNLVPTKDILASMGEKKDKQFLVGFALETNDERENAIGKLKRKNLDAIVLNSLNDDGAGFGKWTNKITFIDAHLNEQSYDLKSKKDVAKDIFTEILQRLP